MSSWEKIEQQISETVQQSFSIENHRSVFGGDINQAFRIDGSFADKTRKSFFIKLNNPYKLDMFEAEAEGLREIENTKTILVPHVVCYGVADDKSYLVLENLEMGSGHANSASVLGRQLALMHKHTHEQFGWYRDNTIGSTIQLNTQVSNWIDFYGKHRLGYQLELAGNNGAPRSLLNKGQELISKLGLFFEGYDVSASLLHGDLWSGNYGYLQSSEPVIYDPAIYYGDREADIAMTELFGGFPAEFYTAYNNEWPLDKNYPKRKTLYNLYHILNHFNLFGGGYASQAENMIDNLLR